MSVVFFSYLCRVKFRKVILYFLMAVYTLVVLHTSIPHDHHNHSATDLLEGRDVCCLVKHEHHQEADFEHTFHHHPRPHHDNCHHIGKYIKTAESLDQFKEYPLFCESLLHKFTPVLELYERAFHTDVDDYGLPDPFLDSRNLRAPPFSI